MKEPQNELMRPPVAQSRLRCLLRAGTLILLIGLLAGCMLPPEPKTEAAEDVFNLYVAILVLAGIVFVGVEGFIIYAIVRYRRKPGDDDLPEQHHGNTLVEIIWTAIPSVIVLILFVLSTITLGTVNARSESPGVTIQVDGFQWQWAFRYPEDVVVQGTAGDPPKMVVPVGEPVQLQLNAIDVIHSFYVPHFLIKRDLVPVGENGTMNELEFTITEEGTYSGQCAEFCGTAHADMTFVIEAVSREAYDAWFEAEKSGEASPPPTTGECETTVEIKANNTRFDVDSFEVPANTEFCIDFENQEAMPHNVAILDGGEPLFQGEFLNEPGSVTYVVDGLPAGEYRFICEAHPQAMVGDVIVSE